MTILQFRKGAVVCEQPMQRSCISTGANGRCSNGGHNPSPGDLLELIHDPPKPNRKAKKTKS